MFKEKQMLETLQSIDKKLTTLVSLAKSNKIKEVAKEVKE